MSNYGKKGGIGATAGRKAERISAISPHDGAVFTKRVYFGQRWLVVTRCLDNSPTTAIVTAWDEADARKHQGALERSEIRKRWGLIELLHAQVLA